MKGLNRSTRTLDVSICFCIDLGTYQVIRNLKIVAFNVIDLHFYFLCGPPRLHRQYSGGGGGV